MSTVPNLAAAMRYRDVAGASDWLCAAFGFQKHFAATGETGAVTYAQLTFGDAMLMLAPVRDFAVDTYMKQPDEIGGAETQSCYLMVGDADAHYAQAKAAGAEIILDIQDDDFGGRSYSCRDPEGHIWNFGTYDPWRGGRGADRQARPAGDGSRSPRRWAALVGLAIVVAFAVTAAAMYGALSPLHTVGSATRQEPDQRMLEAVAKEAEERAAQAAQERLGAEQSARQAADNAAREAREQLGRERMARENAERAAEQSGKRLAEERQAKEAAEHSVREARLELERARNTREDGADRAARENREQVGRERAAKEVAERAAEQAAKRLAEEQRAREAAETSVREARLELERVRNAAMDAGTDRAAVELRAQLDRERAAKEAAERAAEQATQRAAEQQSAREAAEKTVKEAREQLAREQSSKNAAWKAAAQLRRQLSQVQSASGPAAEASPETESPKAVPKQKYKQKAKVQAE